MLCCASTSSPYSLQRSLVNSSRVDDIHICLSMFFDILRKKKLPTWDGTWYQRRVVPPCSTFRPRTAGVGEDDAGADDNNDAVSASARGSHLPEQTHKNLPAYFRVYGYKGHSCVFYFSFPWYFLEAPLNTLRAKLWADTSAWSLIC